MYETRVTDFSIDAILSNNIGRPSSNIPTGDNSAIDLTFNLDKIKDELVANNYGKQRPRPKKYQCPFCWVALSNTGQFRGHIRIHTGERPFKCDHPYCEKTFTRNEELTRHKRIHTGQRPYACQLCNKRFGRKDHLKKHTRTHEKHLAHTMKQLQAVSPVCVQTSI